MNMKENILIVEDETDMANLLAYRLSEKGYNPMLASNGREALEIIKKDIPDLILLDLMMEQLDGWEVCSSIRSHTDETIKRLPIIMLTAMSQSEDKIIGLRLGADDYMTKPFNIDELILRIQNQLKKKGVADRLIEQLKRGNNIPVIFYHEVKNQLYIIGAFSDLITRQEKEGKSKEEFIGRLKNATVALSEYLDGMSLFSKIESGEKKIRIEKFSLNTLINKIVLSYNKDAAVREIQIETSLDKGRDIVNLNSIAMKMVLSNLIGNAIKYNKKNGSVFITTLREPPPSPPFEGGEKGEVREGDKLVITIEDSGIGIAPADMPYIFDKFYRSRSVDGHIDGTGIGLYIVKTLVNAVGGEIESESTLGKGSKFTITFSKDFNENLTGLS